MKEQQQIIFSTSPEEQILKQFLHFKQNIQQGDVAYFMKRELISHGIWFLFALHFHGILETALQLMFKLYDSRNGQNSKDFIQIFFEIKIGHFLKKIKYSVVPNLNIKNSEQCLKKKEAIQAARATGNKEELIQLQRREDQLRKRVEGIQKNMQFSDYDMVLQFMEHLKGENEKKPKQRAANVANFKLKYLRGRATGIYQQMVINTLRRHIDCVELKEELLEHICCRLYFDQTTTLSPKAYNHHDFRRFDPPNILELLNLQLKLDGDNEEYLLGLCPVVVAFLNGGGGIHYRGIQQSLKDGPFQIVGVNQTNQSKKVFLRQVRDCFLKYILPVIDSKLEEEEELYFQKSLQQTSLCLTEQQDYYISKYISVEFLPIVDPIHMANKRTGNICCYIVKIKVQQGDPGTVYHMETQHRSSLDGFKRNGGLTEMYDFEQFRLILESRCREKDRLTRLRQIHTDCYFKFIDKYRMQ